MFYEPARGHGLPHDPLNAIVAPRPIGWISSISPSGEVNLAPFSYFNGISSRPPMVMFACNRAPDRASKDTLANLRARGEFVFNFVSRELGAAMNLSSAPLPHGGDEFALSWREFADPFLIGVDGEEDVAGAFEQRKRLAFDAQPAVVERAALLEAFHPKRNDRILLRNTNQHFCSLS